MKDTDIVKDYFQPRSWSESKLSDPSLELHLDESEVSSDVVIVKQCEVLIARK